MIDLYKLRHFVAVARAGSYVIAADELHLSQPALSRSIQALEAHLGVKLLDRSRSGVRATAVGMQMLSQADDLLNMASALETKLTQAADGHVGTVHFGIGPMLAAIVLPDCTSALLQSYPGIQTRVYVESAHSMHGRLLEGDLEFYVGLVGSGPEADRLDVEVIGSANPCFLTRQGHPLVGIGRMKPDQLKGYPRISGTAWSETLSGTWRRRYPDLFTLTLEVDNYDLLRRIAMDTEAILIASYGVELDGLTLLDVDVKHEISPLTAIHRLRSRTLSPAAETVLRVLKVAIASRTRLTT